MTQVISDKKLSVDRSCDKSESDDSCRIIGVGDSRNRVEYEYDYWRVETKCPKTKLLTSYSSIKKCGKKS